ncbi:MAG: hypothetical protein IKZ44_05325 [Clostridia bacterium]|nr:hypothetical protein [Clostridia bacterium]
MKKWLLAIGIVLIVASILSLLFAALQLFGYYHVLDGSATLYARLHRRAIVSFIVGGALAVGAVACLILRARK